MKNLFVLGIFLIASVLMPAMGQAAPVPAGTIVKAPDWVAGSEWYYSDGYALKVSSVSPKATVFDRVDAPGQWFARQGFIRTDSATPTATRNAIYRTVPDAAGYNLSAGHPLTFQREYLNNGKLLVHASSWTVEGRETITVPAGTFDCWVIVWRTRSLRSDWTGFERWWYSPEVQNYVRMEFKYGPEPDGSRVLMRYHLGAAAPVPAAASPTPAAPPVAAPTAPVLASSLPAPQKSAAPVTAKVEPATAHVAKNESRLAAALPPAPKPEAHAPRPEAPAAAISYPAQDARIAAVSAASSAPTSQARLVKADRSAQPEKKHLEIAALPNIDVRDVEPEPVSAAQDARMAAPSEIGSAPRLQAKSIKAARLAPVTKKDIEVSALLSDTLPEIAVEAEPASAGQPEKKDVALAALTTESKPEPQAELPKEAQASPAKPVKAASLLPKGDKAGPWHAQLGSAQDASRIRAALKKILSRNPGAHELPNGVTVRDVDGRTFYRAWLGSYDSAEEAHALCEVLKTIHGMGCAIFKGPTTMEARAD